MEGVGREGCLPGPGSGLVSDQWMRAGAAVFLAAGPAPPSWLAVHGEYGTASRVREPGGGQAAAGGGFHGRGAGGVSAVPVAVHDRGESPRVLWRLPIHGRVGRWEQHGSIRTSCVTGRSGWCWTWSRIRTPA